MTSANNIWPLGYLMAGSPVELTGEDDKYRLSFSGVPEKGYFEEFLENRRFSGVPQNENAGVPGVSEFLGVPSTDNIKSLFFPSKNYFEEFTGDEPVTPLVVNQENALQAYIDNVRVNTNIEFAANTSSFTKDDLGYLNSVYTDKTLSTELPVEFNWAKIYPDDSQGTIAKKRLIAKPDNQYLCGSCWAVATAGVIGDKFVVAGLVNWVPNISNTYALTNYPQGKCQGGDPARLLRDISRGKIPSKHCIDYSWCSKNKACTTADSAAHFGNDLSPLIPRDGKCYFDSEHYIYSIDSNAKTIVAGVGAVDVSNVQRTIKEHILTNGPAIAGYIIFKNFTVGRGIFNKINGGVYLEKANYGSYNGGQLTFSTMNTDSSQYSGGHAVAVMGWGIEKNIKVDNGPNDFADVPYWYCRNSWGTSWGIDGGYFKIAMFPYNRKSQFSKIVELIDPTGQPRRLGGVLSFTVSSPPVLGKLPSKTMPPQNLIRPAQYYSQDEDEVVTKDADIVPPDKEHMQSTTSSSLSLYILVGVLVIVLIFLFSKKL
ncbi:Papain-like proteinase [Armadillidium vulgare iridescent virus]|uniref:Papain-like proteinase n=1 Tax=Armadillidium vulgare iridescent virus TaxID=72201 RepID=A0A068QL66_9VIRU|nr:Papain-like proteinase [Armadillidium vulgare iridescent virus]CCV02540.1 Papain-like proteinase [Armadillidium vulgare iridescent virus]